MSSGKLRTERPGHFAKVYKYPCGVFDVVCSSSPDFRRTGWEEADAWAQPEAKPKQEPPEEPKRSASDEAKAEDVERSMRRARAKVRRIALSNEFRWFVTLTLDPARIDRYDAGEVVRKLSQWCSNQVKRRGLKYILVPERHKDGALHFHGFFSDALEAKASGHRDKGGHMIYNLPGWKLGFTAAIEVYGHYPQAVAYVCKYIGKQGEKPAGRWYYSGGDLREPEVDYRDDISLDSLLEKFYGKTWQRLIAGRVFAGINGLDGVYFEDIGDIKTFE